MSIAITMTTATTQMVILAFQLSNKIRKIITVARTLRRRSNQNIASIPTTILTVTMKAMIHAYLKMTRRKRSKIPNVITRTGIRNVNMKMMILACLITKIRMKMKKRKKKRKRKKRR